MKLKLIKFISILCLCMLCGCSDEDPAPQPDPLPCTEKTVAIVLPMHNGLDAHWARCLGMFAGNLERAFRNQDTGVRLNFEYYDEASADMERLAGELAFRDDVYAVIGGLYSSDASILATQLTRAGKTFFTLATSEELVRAFASTGYLWALTN